MTAFRRPVTIRFEEADARGVLFYGRLQALAHHVWEDFVVSQLVERWEDWFESRDFVAPIKHAEATYHRPLRPGHHYVAELAIAKVGESSFEVVTKFLDESTSEAVLCAEARVVKVLADPNTWKKIAIPAGIRERLLRHLTGVQPPAQPGVQRAGG
jgi:acyl-CoA thioesterase FadM